MIGKQLKSYLLNKNLFIKQFYSHSSKMEHSY